MFFKDTAQASDTISITKSINPSCIRDELEPLLQASNSVTSDGQLIVIYILLQVYIENHFHYYLGFLIGNGFSSATPLPCWQERDHVPQKLTCFETVLSTNGISYDKQLLASVTRDYSKLTITRNALAHGHPLTETTGDGKLIKSKAKEYLEIETLKAIVITTNNMMFNWNALLEQLEGQKNVVKASPLPEVSFLKNCKFTKTFVLNDT